MKDLYTEFVLKESLENKLDSDREPLHLLVPEANYHVVENRTIEKILEEGRGKAEKKIKEKKQIKGKRKEKGKEKGKGKRKGKKQRKGNGAW